MDDVTGVVEGAGVGEVVRRLEQCAAATLDWASSNAVRIEETKTEAILFSKKKIDSTLSLVENRRRRVAKARQAGARLRRITARYGVPPAAARKLQSAIVQVTMLYAAELTWSGKKGVEGEYQQAINRMGRATLGAFRSTPLEIVAAESGLMPARALLDH